MDVYRPDDVAFEELFFSKNITTGMAVSMARGVALVAVVERTPNLYEYTPMQIKQAVTGYGGADKHQVQQMVRLLLNMKETAPARRRRRRAGRRADPRQQRAREAYVPNSVNKRPAEETYVAHIEGVVAEKTADSIVLDVHGVGFLLTVSGATLAAAPAAASE